MARREKLHNHSKDPPGHCDVTVTTCVVFVYLTVLVLNVRSLTGFVLSAHGKLWQKLWHRNGDGCIDGQGQYWGELNDILLA